MYLSQPSEIGLLCRYEGFKDKVGLSFSYPVERNACQRACHRRGQGGEGARGARARGERVRRRMQGLVAHQGASCVLVRPQGMGMNAMRVCMTCELARVSVPLPAPKVAACGVGRSLWPLPAGEAEVLGRHQELKPTFFRTTLSLASSGDASMASSSQSSKEAQLRESLQARRQSSDGAADMVQRQRARTSWTYPQREDGINPTLDGLLAGTKYGVVSTLLAVGAVSAGNFYSPAFRASLSPGGKAWLICTVGMAGFFINSEMAVVGTEARERAAAAADSRAS